MSEVLKELKEEDDEEEDLKDEDLVIGEELHLLEHKSEGPL